MLEQTDGLFEALEKLKKQSPEGGGLVLTIPENSSLLNNLLTLKILKRESKKLGIELELQTDDLRGKNLLAALTPTEPSPDGPTAFGFQEGVDIYTEAGQAVVPLSGTSTPLSGVEQRGASSSPF